MKKLNFNLVLAACVLLVGTVMCYFAPQFFIQHYSEFSNTGQIGDTIGGTNAPIIGLISAILVYMALREQVKANVILQNQIRDQEISSQQNLYLRYIKEGIDAFSMTIEKPKQKHSSTEYQHFNIYGSEALLYFWGPHSIDKRLDELEKDIKFVELVGILEIFNVLMKSLQTSLSKERSEIWVLANHQFRYRLLPGLYKSFLLLNIIEQINDPNSDLPLLKKFCANLIKVGEDFEIDLHELTQKTI